jgi:chitinase
MSASLKTTRLLPFVRIESDLPAVAEGQSAPRSIVFAIVLSEAAISTVRVSFATVNGSAAAGEDYQARSGTLSFLAGETRKTFAVWATGDTAAEFDETFYVEITSLTGPAVMQPDETAVTATIVNDDGFDLPFVGFDTDTVLANEGFEGARNLILQVTLSFAVSTIVRVKFETSNGSASHGSDYAFRSGQLVFRPGETQATFGIRVLGDATYEQDERLYVDLFAVTGPAQIDTNRNLAVGLILNDDTTTLPSVRVLAATVSRAEGHADVRNVVFTAELSFAALALIQVTFTTLDGSAQAGADYVARTGTLNFQPGQTTRTIGVQILGDTAFEADETFYFELVSVRGPALLNQPNATTIALILNDDLPEAIAVASSDIW